jgi:hypothetical protein
MSELVEMILCLSLNHRPESSVHRWLCAGSVQKRTAPSP